MSRPRRLPTVRIQSPDAQLGNADWLKRSTLDLIDADGLTDNQLASRFGIAVEQLQRLPVYQGYVARGRRRTAVRPSDDEQ